MTAFRFGLLAIAALGASAIPGCGDKSVDSEETVSAADYIVEERRIRSEDYPLSDTLAAIPNRANQIVQSGGDEREICTIVSDLTPQIITDQYDALNEEVSDNVTAQSLFDMLVAEVAIYTECPEPNQEDIAALETITTIYNRNATEIGES